MGDIAVELGVSSLRTSGYVSPFDKDKKLRRVFASLKLPLSCHFSDVSGKFPTILCELSILFGRGNEVSFFGTQ